jgi:hypothetical protein
MKKIATSTIFTLAFIFVFWFLLGLGAKIAHQPAGINGALLIATMATSVGFIALVIWGIPVHLFLRYKNITGVHWYFLSGFLPGIVTVFVFHFFGNDTLTEKLLQSLILGLTGAITATIFYAFVREKRPKHYQPRKF